MHRAGSGAAVRGLVNTREQEKITPFPHPETLTGIARSKHAVRSGISAAGHVVSLECRMSLRILKKETEQCINPYFVKKEVLAVACVGP